MARHFGPEFTAPPEERCGALVKGQPTWVFDWMKVDHQCPKRANQMRGQTPVCHLHAKAKTLTPWTKS